MSNPWLKKNPFMSMWMSAAYRMAGTLRGQATAQVRSQVRAAVTEATNASIKSRSAAVTGPAVKKTRKR